MHGTGVDDFTVDCAPSDPDALAGTDARARRLLDGQGWFLARRLFGDEQLSAVRGDVGRLIALRWRRAGLGPGPPSEPEPRFDDGFLTLARLREAETDLLQGAVSLLLSARQLADGPSLERLSRLLLGTQ